MVFRLTVEINKAKIKINKPINLGFSILGISKTIIYEFFYDCIKPKYQGKANLCYMETDSFIVSIKSEDVYEDIANNVQHYLALQTIKLKEWYQ